jgi:egghead protein (zeste-white 4 protein)
MTDHSISASSKHLLFCLVMFIWLFGFGYFNGAIRFGPSEIDQIDPWTKYGTYLTCFLLFIRFLSFLGLPQILFDCVGLVCYNICQEPIVLKSSPLLAPFVCIRVVTRGLYPKLVRDTVAKNIETLTKAGLENYMVQVVTDSPVGVGDQKRVEELVVPSTYKTKSGALNKAR